MDWTAVWLTLRLALATTIILFVVGLPVAYWLATTRSAARHVIEAFVALPLVLPPTVLGFYVLSGLGPNSGAGGLFHDITGSMIPFTFGGILLASVLYNLPFSIRPFASAFAGVDRRLVEASWSLGASRLRTFFRVSCALGWPGILTGLILTFAHTVGEFGVVLMVGGNIPGVTRTLSIAIYDDVQALNYEAAAQTSLLLVGFSLIVLIAAQVLGRRTASV